MDSEFFVKTPPTELFFKCAVPVVITSVFGALYSVVDGFFVGRYLGEGALAAVNLIMPVIMIVEALSNMVATGSSINISILLAGGKREEASRVFSFSVKFILLFSCVVGVLGFFFARPFVSLLAPGASKEAIELGIQYLEVYALFGPLIPIYFATDNYLRVCGKQKLSMIINIATQVLNVTLDFVLIVVFKKGIVAAATASCLSIAIGSIITLYLFRGKRLDVFYTRASIPVKQFLHILANGSSEFFSIVANSIMSIVMNLFLLKYGGTTAVAAFSIVMYVDSIIGMINFGICDSLQPAISYCYGANAPERTKALFHRMVLSTIVVSIVTFVFMFFAGSHVSRIFINPDDTSLISMSVIAIRIFSFSYFFGWIDMCYSALFSALDKPVRSIIVSCLGSLVFPIFYLFALTPVFELNGIWLMATASSLSSGIITLLLARNVQYSVTPGSSCFV